MVVGIFELTQIGLGHRWSVKNTLTDVTHVTYGTEEEVVQQLGVMTDSWARRGEKRRRGGWKGQQHIEVAQQRARR